MQLETLLLASMNGLAHQVFYAQQAAHFKGHDVRMMHTVSGVALHGMLQTLHGWCCCILSGLLCTAQSAVLNRKHRHRRQSGC